MKHVFILLLCCLLLLSAAHAETIQNPEGITSMRDLISAADEALTNGADSKMVITEMNEWATDRNLGDELSYVCDNIASFENEDYQKISDYEAKEANQNTFYFTISNPSPYETVDPDGGTIYDTYEVSQAFRTLLANKKAQFCYKPFCWPEGGFKEVFGVEYSRFKPSNPRAGYVCVIIGKGMEPEPEIKWSESNWEVKNLFGKYTISKTLEMIREYLGEDAPVFTGNPQLASEFWVIEAKYPYYARYGEKGDIKGYNYSLTFTAVNATTRNVLGTLSTQNRLGNTIYSWKNGIAKADIRALYMESNYAGLIEKLRTALTKERNTAAADQKITVFNASSVLNGILMQRAEKATEAWQKAIFESGAQNVSLTDDALTFTMRSFSMPSDSLQVSPDYDLERTLPLKEGRPTANGLEALRTAVGKAATEAKKSFSSQQNTLVQMLFPEPVTGKLTDAAELLTPSDDFKAFLEKNSSLFGGVPEDAWSAIFYGQGKQTVGTEGGPHAVTLKSTGIAINDCLAQAEKAVLDTQAYVSKDERIQDKADLEKVLLQKLAETAVQLKKNPSNKLAVTVDLDELTQDRLPAEYTEYMSGFAYFDYVDKLNAGFDQLLDIPAIEMPKTGRISGSNSGTDVIFKLTGSTNATYIQMRNAETEEIVVTAFVHPRKQITVNVPKGEYFICWCSGPYWYGEEKLFGTAGAYSKSEVIEIKGPNYNHTFTLESVENGDIPIEQASPADFQ